MDRPDLESGIYWLDESERTVTPTGPALVGPNGERQDIPTAVFAALEHVVEAMRRGKAVKVTPLRTDLPVEEAAHAIGLPVDILQKYVDDGTIPHRSTEHYAWVQLADVVAFQGERDEHRRKGMRELSDLLQDEAEAVEGIEDEGGH